MEGTARCCIVLILNLRATVAAQYYVYVLIAATLKVASSPGHSQILSRSREEKSGEGLVPILRHGPEVVDLVSM